MSQNSSLEAAAQEEAVTQVSYQNANAAAQSAAIVQVVLNEANNAAAIAALISLQRVLQTIVGLTRTQCAGMAADGYEDFIDFEKYNGTALKNVSPLQERATSIE